MAEEVARFRDECSWLRELWDVNAVVPYFPRLRRVADYVDTHIAEPILAEDVARLACLERKYFSTYFKCKTGITFTHWVALKRVNHAIDLLYLRDDGLTQVAAACGFADLRAFERACKRFTGLTPKQLKERAAPRACLS
jgi:AraC family transcriptional regulator